MTPEEEGIIILAICLAIVASVAFYTWYWCKVHEKELTE